MKLALTDNNAYWSVYLLDETGRPLNRWHDGESPTLRVDLLRDGWAADDWDVGNLDEVDLAHDFAADNLVAYVSLDGWQIVDAQRMAKWIGLDASYSDTQLEDILSVLG